jgi:hypothetical protein
MADFIKIVKVAFSFFYLQLRRKCFSRNDGICIQNLKTVDVLSGVFGIEAHLAS